MLYQLGLLTIRHAPFTADRMVRSSAADFASQPVLGREPPLEYVGPGETDFVITGTLFPKAIGGLTELAILGAMLDSGRPQFLMRGDGVPLGWVAIREVREESTYLDDDGVGRRIEVAIRCTRAGAPPAARLFEVMAGIFG